MLLVADRVEDLPNIRNRRHFLIIRATLTYPSICEPEDPYRFGGRGDVQVVRQGSRERCTHLVRVQCAGTKQEPLPTPLSVEGTVLRDAA